MSDVALFFLAFSAGVGPVAVAIHLPSGER
jgi:hypothetical protein